MNGQKISDQIKINILGTHGVGKSTLCFQIANLLKQSNNNVKIIAENIRGCPFEINQKAKITTELWTFHKTFLDELNSLAEKYDTIILDRGVLDVVAYFSDRCNSHYYFDIIKELAFTWAINEYDLFILVEPDDLDRLYITDIVRDADIEFRKRIVYIFRDLLHQIREDIQDKLIRVYSSEIFSSEKAIKKIGKQLGSLGIIKTS